MLDDVDFLRLAVDPVRLAILGRCAVGMVDAHEVAAALGVPPDPRRRGVYWRTGGWTM